ncbi:helix-turn-helix domain-containing protein [Nocardiopsis sp. HNM0947]|uniref:Helix-turn-helix domain-containing protein n=1 Tax=Nocardiopsis coralli TaxID=2772213 RepID=A0ABR9PC04_9ACTN|nr:helix-turn-helix transcriptional regulator [Nocardiopsis coralli]MBE3001372.1 helix-turn-helix domain-containing protein [Nocardiopsis coralli]
MEERFGPGLRRRRIAAGLSLTALGEATHYSKGYLSKLETGTKPPSPEAAIACDAALDAEGGLSALAPDRRITRSAPGVDRRTALALGAATLGAASLPGHAPGTAPARVFSEQTLSTFRDQLAGVRELGQHVSPDLVLPVVRAQADAVRALAASAPDTQRGTVLRLAARFSEYAGWMAQESGSDHGARAWTDEAVELAAAGGDRDMAAYSLVRHALIRLYAHDGPGTVDLARRAQRFDGLSTRVRGLAAKREAQGHALLGARAECERALERAQHHLADPPGGPETLGSMHVTDPVGLTRGWCLVDLGRPDAGAEVLDRALAELPSAAVRARTRFGVRRALAHAAAGEIDHACTLTEGLLCDATPSESATVLVDLRRLAQALGRYHGHPPVRELSPRLQGVLQSR